VILCTFSALSFDTCKHSQPVSGFKPHRAEKPTHMTVSSPYFCILRIPLISKCFLDFYTDRATVQIYGVQSMSMHGHNV
jgi:hypothetical protein